MRNNYIELLRDMKFPFINFSKNKFESENTMDFALEIRKILNISLSEQKNGYLIKIMIKKIINTIDFLMNGKMY